MISGLAWSRHFASQSRGAEEQHATYDAHRVSQFFIRWKLTASTMHRIVPQSTQAL
jgi:hypothetical protein